MSGWECRQPETTMASLGPPVMKPIRHILNNSNSNLFATFHSSSVRESVVWQNLYFSLERRGGWDRQCWVYLAQKTLL